MASRPDPTFGALASDRPTSSWLAEGFVAVPSILAPRTFQEDSALLTLGHLDPQAQLEWSRDGGVTWELYSAPVVLNETTDVLARAVVASDTSVTVGHRVLRVDHNWTLMLNTPPDNQYTAGGDQALIDGLQGGADFRTGEWQGFWGENCVATLDLGQTESVRRVKVRALQDIKPWIWAPRRVLLSTSTDGRDFDLVATLPCSLAEDDADVQIEEFVCDVPFEAQYLRVEAEGYGPIPEWHLGRGNDRWMFLDEIVVGLAE